MAMDIRKIKKLIELLEESNLVELEIREGEETVRLSRWPKNMPMAAMASPVVSTPSVTRSRRREAVQPPTNSDRAGSPGRT